MRDAWHVMKSTTVARATKIGQITNANIHGFTAIILLN